MTDAEAFAKAKATRNLAEKYSFSACGLLGVVEHADGSATAYRLAMKE